MRVSEVTNALGKVRGAVAEVQQDGSGGAPKFAAEAAARRLALKRHCIARLRASAESRVHPRTREAVTRPPPSTTFAAKAAARHLPLKRHCIARLRASA